MSEAYLISRESEAKYCQYANGSAMLVSDVYELPETAAESEFDKMRQEMVQTAYRIVRDTAHFRNAAEKLWLDKEIQHIVYENTCKSEGTPVLKPKPVQPEGGLDELIQNDYFLSEAERILNNYFMMKCRFEICSEYADSPERRYHCRFSISYFVTSGKKPESDS